MIHVTQAIRLVQCSAVDVDRKSILHAAAYFFAAYFFFYPFTTNPGLWGGTKVTMNTS